MPLKLGVSIHDAIEKAETALGFVFQNVVTIGIAGFLEYMLVDARTRNHETPFWIAGAVLWLLIDLPCLWHLWRTLLRGSRPMFIVVALRISPKTILFRPFAAIWWFAHFLCGALLIIVGERSSTRNEPILAFFTATCFSYAANGYLTYALGAVTKSETFLQRAWPWRILVDLTFGLATMVPALLKS